MKYLIASVLCFALFSSKAQDSTYYNNAKGLRNDSLKTALHQIIDNHIEFSYTSSSTDVWDILKVTDQDTVDPTHVILIYSGRSVDGPQEYNGGNGWTREHVWAKSRGDFGTSKGPGTDVHHLRPCDNSVNSTRNNRNFDTCQTCSPVIDNGFNTGSFVDTDLWTFEPPDEVKGDVARMLFYMAVRYEGDAGEPDLELTDQLLSNTSKDPLQARLSTLMYWNAIDSVSDWERRRNDIIFDQFQQNRNPFIDHPELAEYLWGDKIDDYWMKAPGEPSDTTSVIEVNPLQVRVFPNPNTGTFSMVATQAISTVNIYTMHGVFVKTITQPQQTVNCSDLPKGVYLIRVEDMQGNMRLEKIIIQ